jgi:hypothetical protein
MKKFMLVTAAITRLLLFGVSSALINQPAMHLTLGRYRRHAPGR